MLGELLHGAVESGRLRLRQGSLEFRSIEARHCLADQSDEELVRHRCIPVRAGLVTLEKQVDFHRRHGLADEARAIAWS